MKAAVLNIVRCQATFKQVNSIGGTSDNTQSGAVYQRDSDVVFKIVFDLLLGRRNGKHDARRLLLHDLGAVHYQT